MANPIILSVTGVGNSQWIMPDWRAVPFAVALNVYVSGTITYTVQDTPDDCMVGTPSNINNHPTLAALSAQATGNYAFPVRGIRLNTSAGSGTATLIIVQGEAI